MSEGALRVRLLRARRALRAALSADDDLRAQLEDLGLTLPASDGWQESRIWCPFCGASYLRYRIDRETGEYAFHCAGGCAGLPVAGRAKGPRSGERGQQPQIASRAPLSHARFSLPHRLLTTLG